MLQKLVRIIGNLTIHLVSMEKLLNAQEDIRIFYQMFFINVA